MKRIDHEKVNMLRLIGIIAAVILLSGCIGNQPTVKYQPGNQTAIPAQVVHWNFDTDPVGGLPQGANVFSGNWAVRAEADTPTPPNALCQAGTAEFPALSLSDTVYSDVIVSTSFKPISGSTDQAAGIIFRIQDKDNYYILRANALENNVNIYRYADGRRSTIKEGSANVVSGRWQELRVEATGNRIRGFLNGQLVVEATDDTYKAGKVGLWTKSDSVTCFDGVTASSPSTPGTENKSIAQITPARSGIASSSGDLAEIAGNINMSWPLGTATPPEECGVCHSAIYREYAFGFGSDLQYKGIVYKSPQEKLLKLPSNISSTGTAHFLAGLDPFPIHARGIEEEGRSCDVCHFPQAFEIPDMELLNVSKPVSRPKTQEIGGLTCASCHLTPDGKIRGPYDVEAPHLTVRDTRMQTSAMCAYCHSMGARVAGKQTQTFLEWREDFNKPGLGRQHCQDCHMFRTLRKSADYFDVPERAVARHLWTGGHSTQRLRTALNLVIIQPQSGLSGIEFHVINIGAGHSVPTGSNRRAVYLKADVVNGSGKAIASKEWMFAPWYGNRPDDKVFLEEDKKRPDAVAALQADAQGPHEASIRAGEERVLSWVPQLMTGNYTVQASLIYDLNRYNERNFTEDQTDIYHTSLSVKVE